uniref:Uncharacterized protein n=1 Tax=viral metagenome TaxID=1070528 RepID=A0A6C0JPD6_9ZZZZ
MHVSPKMKHAVMLGLLFFVVSSPYTYKLVDRLVAPVAQMLVPASASLFKIAEGGCPTTYGLLVHSAVFALVAYYLHTV